ncbi:alpha/beta fold hydrolase [Actinomadura viridis]|uniref:Surfactin synthase thioesterase subunit n=1 Tax=Actinomadura viridis TaxID=58110 RepID=A0A931DIC4_9ACTN|nr:alpha/beta fold hydrolase [Actinomadura viridis]MBG6090565.1 surfactin synthase thioesterase subunit [Actinomadura viridis]
MTREAARGRAFRGLAGPAPGGRPRLFCVPYAGGGENAFDSWTPLVAGHFDVHVARLPGRGGRFGEPFPESLRALVRDLAAEMAPHLGEEAILFGHSMGATIALELARELRYAHGARLGRLVVSGRPAPGTRRRRLHELDDEELAAVMRALGGTHPEVLGQPELWEVLAPILRGDLRLIETHEVAEGPPLDCPVAAYGAVHDPDTTPPLLEGWARVGTGPFSTRIFPGGHFYFRTHPEALATELLTRFAPRPS